MHTTQVAALQGLMPTYIPQLPHLMVLDPLSLSILRISPMLMFDEELHCWKSKWSKIPQNDRRISLNETLKECTPDALPNVFTLLKLFATLPLKFMLL